MAASATKFGGAQVHPPVALLPHDCGSGVGQQDGFLEGYTFFTLLYCSVIIDGDVEVDENDQALSLNRRGRAYPSLEACLGVRTSFGVCASGGAGSRQKEAQEKPLKTIHGQSNQKARRRELALDGFDGGGCDSRTVTSVKRL